MNLCLNMIVRNESARIERALKSAAPYIRSWIICDTGSTDDTKDKIIRFFRDLGIPGEIRDTEFKDFSQARNEALTWGRKLHFAYAPTHFLLMDADMELVVKNPAAFGDLEGGICWEMDQQGGTVTYANKRILSAVGKWDYKGVTHEYLDAPSTGAIPRDIAMFIDHADGSNRDKKYARDIRLLKRGLKDEPTNERYFYYLASSYRDAGKHAEAAKWFQRRVRAGGWDEEVWSAQVGYAHALKDLGDEAGFIRELLVAYNMRPQRAEAMYDLAHYLRLKDIPLAAHAAASAVEHTPLSADRLFVNEFPYKVGIRQELAITSFYVPGQMEHGRRLNDELTLERTAWPAVANEARANQFFYLPKLETVAPSFRYHNIAFTPPDDLVPLNPSVVSHLGRFLVNVRAVNYRIDDDGRYIIKATDGTANAENPIDTRNFILDFGCDPESAPFCPAFECYRPGNMPVEWPLVTGFEDVRLISFADALWGSATVRQLCADGQCEQVLTELVEADVHELVDPGFQHKGLKRMLRTPRETEKNWSPILDPYPVSPLQFMWRPGVVVDIEGNVVVNNPPPFYTDNLCGSSQVIPWWDDDPKTNLWLAVLHTSHADPKGKRYYNHRFVQYGPDFKVQRLSLPFVFEGKTIEFCAGMAHHPAQHRLVLSYGVRDCEAHIGTIGVDDVQRLLKEGHNYGY